jgi:hypothetical protein
MLSKLLGLNALQPVVELAVDLAKDLAKDLNDMPQVANDISDVSTQIIEKLLDTPGMTQYRGIHFKKATPNLKLKDGTIIKTYKNSARVDHVFLADSNGKMLFGGYVGWIHSDDLKTTIAEIKEMFV